MEKKIKDLESATGPIQYSLTNDYMFRSVFQESKEALKGLLCAVLHLREDEIKEIEICNPVELGKNIESKDFILDLKITFNNDTIVNIEMQVMNLGNWPERSLSYLCRNFDNINKGSDYINVKTAIHIGFIDFTLFDDYPEFCATYMMRNIKNHNLYSSKFILKVVELNHVELATEEDIYYGIDQWARLFKATTWEELKMYAANNKAMENVVNKVFEYNSEETIRDICRAREESLAYQKYVDDRTKRMEEALAEREAKLIKLDEALAEKDEALAEKDEALAEKDEALAEKDEALKRKDAELAEAKELIAKLQAQVSK